MSYAFVLIVAIITITLTLTLTFWSTMRRKKRLEERLRRHDKLTKNGSKARSDSPSGQSLMGTISPLKSRGAPIDLPGAETEIQPAPTAPPPKVSPEKVQSRAAGLLLHGRYHEVINILQPQVNRTPHLVNMRLILAEAYARTGNLSALTQQELDIKALGDESALRRLKVITESFDMRSDPVESTSDTASNVVKLPVNELEDIDLLADTDENTTKLDLARAYLDMGDHEAAREILKEVQDEGNAAQQEECLAILARFPS